MLPALGVQRVGLYTSPHLVSFRERIRVDGEPVPAAFVADWLGRHIAVLEDLNPTYFECVTALAFAWFRACGCEAVVLETGLGGRLDATNVVAPSATRVTAITAVSLDHTAILGNTHEAILGEKLGIVKPGVPLVLDEARPALARQAEEAARHVGAPLWNMADRLRPAPHGMDGWMLGGRFRDYALPADLRTENYQVRNAALAVLALEAFHGAALPVEAAWIPALQSARARMPGRMQRLEPADQAFVPVLLDGAHNPAAAEALRDQLHARPLGTKLRIFFSAMSDKDYAGLYAILHALSDDLVFIDLSATNPRALSGETLLSTLTDLTGRGALSGDAGIRIITPAWDALEPLLRADSGADSAIFCGSLYLLGEVIPLLAPRYEGLEEFKCLVREDGE
jgi:dihydrofolate synthase/folylpolyglutamate synthase